MHETCFIIINDPGIRPGPESKPGTFGLADECFTAELSLLSMLIGLILKVERYLLTYVMFTAIACTSREKLSGRG